MLIILQGLRFVKDLQENKAATVVHGLTRIKKLVCPQKYRKSTFISTIKFQLLRASLLASMLIRPPSIKYPMITSPTTHNWATSIVGVISPNPKVVNVTTL